MRNSKNIYFYKNNFLKKIVFILLIMVLIAVSDFADTKIFPDRQSIEEKSHITIGILLLFKN